MKIKIKVRVCFPATIKSWNQDFPERWTFEDKEIEAEINSIMPYKWGHRQGMRVSYDGRSAWFFTEDEIIFIH